MVMADEGYSQTQICEALGCSQETARYWMARARDGQAHQWNDNPMGRPKTISDEYLDRLKDLVKRSPREYGYSFERWTARWLGKHLAKELGIEVCDRHISRLLKEMGLSTRPRPDTAATDLPKTKDSGIAIRDLPSSPGFWLPFNPIKTNQ
jgi:putative transposase